MSNATCTSAAQDFCLAVTSNPDISGIGVRTAIYVQTFLNMIVPSILPNNLTVIRDTARSTYVLSVGLIAASIGQWCIGGLTLFDGLVSTMLTTLMTAFALSNYQYIETLGLSMNISSALFLIFWTYWGIQVWVDPSTFGLQLPEPEPVADPTTNLAARLFSLHSRALDPSSPLANCTANLQTQFVIFGKSIPATNSGLRVFALVTFGMAALPALVAIYHVVWWSLAACIHGELKVRAAQANKNVKKEKYSVGEGSGKTRVKSMGGLAALIYMIVTTEQIVHRNGPDVAEGLSQWTFGQTLAVIMLLQQLLDIIWWFKEDINSKKLQRQWRTRRVGV